MSRRVSSITIPGTEQKGDRPSCPMSECSVYPDNPKDENTHCKVKAYRFVRAPEPGEGSAAVAGRSDRWGRRAGSLQRDSGLDGPRELNDDSSGERLICVVGAGRRGKRIAQAQLLSSFRPSAPAQLSRTSPYNARTPPHLRDRPLPILGVVEDKQ